MSSQDVVLASEQVMEIAQNTATMLGLPPIEDSEVILDDRFNAGICSCPFSLAPHPTHKLIPKPFPILVHRWARRSTDTRRYQDRSRDGSLHHGPRL
jgi:hypothetical protein